MSFFAVWIDRETAKLFQVSLEKMERQTIHFRYSDHHTHSLDELDRKQQERRFFSEVVEKLGPAENILILGPGVAKHHFQNFLIEHYPSLARKVVGCETVDHPTDSQIAAMAKKALVRA